MPEGVLGRPELTHQLPTRPRRSGVSDCVLRTPTGLVKSRAGLPSGGRVEKGVSRAYVDLRPDCWCLSRCEVFLSPKRSQRNLD